MSIVEILVSNEATEEKINKLIDQYCVPVNVSRLVNGEEIMLVHENGECVKI